MAAKSAEFKVRLEPALLADIKQLAAEMGVAQSEVVREGILELKRRRERHEAIDGLIAMAHIGRPKDFEARGKRKR